MNTANNHLVDSSADSLAISTYFSAVYKWMMIALALTALVAWKAASSEQVINFLMKNPIAFIVLIIAQFGLVIALSARAQKMSYGTSIVMFMLYSVLTGLTFSTIFIVYTLASIFKVFLVSSLMYAVASIYGYTTKRNLSAFGQFLFMALIGIIIASLLNFLLASPMIEWVVTVGGVLVFAGLSAYDHQKLKYFALSQGAENLVILGALTLYLDFINLFLMLLRLMGRRN